MASTYVNDLRLNEMATGDQSGSWGTVTNTNLELIGEALGYGNEIIGNADTAITIADGAADPARSFYLKITSSADLTTTRVVTLGPNTVSKVWMIENATTGSQVITIKQGSGATINVPNGQVKMLATDGAGSGGAVLDLLVDVDLTGTTTAVNLDVSGTALVTGVLTTTAATVSNGGGQFNGAINVGVDDTGYDVKFFGDAASAYMLWDASQDDLILGGAARLGIGTTTPSTPIHIVSTTPEITYADSTGDLFKMGVNNGVFRLYNITDSRQDLAIGGTGVATFSGEIIAASLDISGDIDVDGTTNLDVVDIDGAVDMSSTLAISGTTNDGATLAQIAQSGTGRGFSVTRNVASATRAMVNLSQFHASGGAEAVLDIQQTTPASRAIKVTPDGSIDRFSVYGTGALVTTPAAGGHAVFNEGGVDADFRVESDGNANMLFVDGGDNHVNIGTATDLGGVLNVSSSDNTDTLVVYSSDVDANVGPIIRLWRNSGSPADNDGIGAILFSGEDSADAKTDYASIESFALDVTNGTEDGELTLYTVLAGAKVNRLDFNSTETIFNSPGANLDFRVESDTNTHALFVQGSDGNVGIGTDSPSALLHLESDGPSIKLVDNNNNPDYEIKNGNGSFRIIDTTAATDRLNIDSSGNVGIGLSTANGKVIIYTSDISSGENSGLNLYNSSGSDTSWHITPGVAGIDNSTFCIRDGTNNVNALTLAASTGAATLANGLTLTDGNLVVANGHGIDFSAQTATSAGGASTTSELLDHYEEGTWTAAASSGTLGTTSARYTRIGRTVYIELNTVLAGTRGTEGFRITGLPFTCGIWTSGSMYCEVFDDEGTEQLSSAFKGAAASIAFVTWGAEAIGTDFGNGYLVVNGTYIV